MSLDDLIAVAERGTLTTADIGGAVTHAGAAPTETLDAISRRIAEAYAIGELGFTLCDDIMNMVFAYAMATADVELSMFAPGVYEAFDQGEFRGEHVTKRLIAAVLSRGFPRGFVRRWSRDFPVLSAQAC